MSTPLRILLIDDDEVDRLAILRSLSKTEWKAETVIATSATQARDILATQVFDCVFMDYLLPDSDGITLLKHARSLGYSKPIVVVTSQGDEILAAEAIKSGASDYISKRMLTPEGISQVVRNAQRMHNTEEAHRRAEAALRESEARLAEAQRIGRIGGWEIRLPNQQVYWSPQIFRILGFEQGEFVPSFHKYIELLHPEDRSKARDSFTSCMETGLPFRVDVRFKDKRGHIRDMEIHGRPLNRDRNGSVTHLIGTLQDVTDRKRIEAELRIAKETAESAAKARQEFLANMSHEIRTPLNSIMGFAHLLEESKLSPSQQEHLDAINTAGKALLEIINDILDLSKMEAGKLVMHNGLFDLRQLLQETGSIFKPGLRNKPVEFKLTIEEDVPITLWGDKGRLRQVLVNLISNAIKFTQEGWVRLRVAISRNDLSQLWIRFEVEDTGIGIPWERQEAIFERFMQADVATSRAFGGSGLGLTISKRIVELQGGRIGVNSEPGWGSTFWFEIPFGTEVPQGQEVVAEPAIEVPEALPKSVKAHVLVAEDNQLSQLLARKILEQSGFKVSLANNGREVLLFLRDTRPDLILMDVQMPEMDGRETTSIIRSEMLPDIASIPVLGMTAHAVEEELDSCLKAGMNDYLVKPLMPEELLRKIKMLLRVEAVKPLVDLPPLSSFQVIQPEKLHEVTGGDPAMERELIALFQKESVESLNRMEACIRSSDWDGLYKATHFIKPSFYLFGVEEARQLFPEMEKAAKSKAGIAVADPLFRKIRDMHERTRQEVAQYLTTLS
jgi:PAS domain S-box-containing protein